MNKYKKLINNSIIFAIGNLGNKIIQFVLIPLYSFTLTTSQFGDADFLSQIVFLLTPIVSLELFDAAFRFALDKNENKREIINTVSMILSVSALIVLLVSFIIAPFFKRYPIVLTAIFLILNFSFSFFSNFIRALGYVTQFAIAGIVNTFFMGIANVVLLLFMKLGVSGYILAFAIGLFSGVVYILVSTKVYKYFDYSLFNFNKLVQMLKYSFPLIPNYFAWWLNASSDRLFIIMMIGSGANGIYAMANKIPNFISTVVTIFSQSWQISIVEEYKNRDNTTFISNVYNYFFCILILIGCLIMAFIKPFFYLVIDHTYYQGWLLTPILVLAAIYSGVALLLEGIYTAYKETFSVFVTTMIGAIVNVILTILLIHIIGYYGAAWANAVSFFMVFLLRSIEIVHKKILNIDVKRILGYHFIFLIICIFPIIIKNIYLPSVIDVLLIGIVVLSDKTIKNRLFKAISNNLRRHL